MPIIPWRQSRSLAGAPISPGQQPATTDITNRPANRQTQTAKPHIAAASSSHRAAKRLRFHAGDDKADIKQTNQGSKVACRPLTTMPTGVVQWTL